MNAAQIEKAAEELWAGDWTFRKPYYNPKRHRVVKPFATVVIWEGHKDNPRAWAYGAGYRTREAAIQAARDWNAVHSVGAVGEAREVKAVKVNLEPGADQRPMTRSERKITDRIFDSLFKNAETSQQPSQQ